MLTNHTNISPLLAVWLATETYDISDDPTVVSATGLLKPIRATILSRRLKETSVDIINLLPSRLGTAVHAAVEYAWKNNYKEALRLLTIPQNVIDKMVINPTTVEPGQIPIYIEQRAYKEIDGFTISGQLDFVIDGQLHDIKSTGTYNYINGSHNKDYVKQGSIYRWLNPEIITNPKLAIEYVFKDWKAYEYKASPNVYPEKAILTKEFPLMTLEDTEAYIRERIALIKKYENIDQKDLPECTREELWQGVSKWAFYKDPNKTSRATRLFDNQQDAYIANSQIGGTGLVVERKAQVRRCEYCLARVSCTQAESLELQGLLERSPERLS